MEQVSCSGSERSEEVWWTRSGRLLTSLVVRVERWFGGEGERWADACLVAEGEVNVGEDMKADSGRSRMVRFQKSSWIVALSMSLRNTLVNGGRKRTSVPYPK